MPLNYTVLVVHELMSGTYMHVGSCMLRLLIANSLKLHYMVESLHVANSYYTYSLTIVFCFHIT